MLLCLILGFCLASAHSFCAYAGASASVAFFQGEVSSLHAKGMYGVPPNLPVFAPDGDENNRVTLTENRAVGLVTGAYADPAQRQGSTPLLQRNRFTILEGVVVGSAHGAVGENSVVVDNVLIIDGEKALVQGKGSAAFSPAATGAVGKEARQNTLLMHAGFVEGNIFGGHAKASAQGNTIMLHGGVVDGSVFGGSALTGKSFHNTVLMTGGQVSGTLTGGASFSEGAASANTVIFSGGEAGGIAGSQTGNSPANANVILIQGGRIAAPQKKTRKETAKVSGGRSATQGAIRNRIFLGGDVALENCIFYGGESGAADKGKPAETPDVRSGNMLIIEADYGGALPPARNFEKIFLSGSGAGVPLGGYVFHPSVGCFENNGNVRFSGKKPAELRFSQTEYASEQGVLTLYGHARGIDKIVLEKGALLLAPLRLHIKNIKALPPDTSLAIVEIDKASTMLKVNRRLAVEWTLEDEEIENLQYAYKLKLVLSGEDKDLWVIEKRTRNSQ